MSGKVKKVLHEIWLLLKKVIKIYLIARFRHLALYALGLLVLLVLFLLARL